MIRKKRRINRTLFLVVGQNIKCMCAVVVFAKKKITGLKDEKQYMRGRNTQQE